MGSDSVFVSHSKEDKKEINFFTNIAARAGFRVYLMEWEDLEGKYPSERIRDIIKSNWIENVKMVIVLLGENVIDPPSPVYTQNWITFEVGAAADSRKPVWVLENKDCQINYPIPFVSDYYQYELDNVNDLCRIGNIINYQMTNPIGSNQEYKKVTVKCPYEKCNAEFRLWNRYHNQISCPVCRQLISWKSQS